MDENVSGDSFNVDWNTDDELEVTSFCQPTLAAIRENGDVRLEAVVENGEASPSSREPLFKLINHFVGMGFSEKLVSKAIEENEDGDTEAILNALLTYSTMEESPSQEHSSPSNSDSSTSNYNEMYDLSETDSWSEDEIEEHPNIVSEKNLGSLSEKEKKVMALASMGYTMEEVSIAMERCGQDASVSILTDFIHAAQMARDEDYDLPKDDLEPKHIYKGSSSNKRKHQDICRKKKIKHPEKKRKHQDVSRKNNADEDTIRLPKPMIGFSIPSLQTNCPIRRTLPEYAQGPPYFYYENVALAPKGSWETISRFLYEIEPEFVDSKYFCATTRKRGYVHNLPIEKRFPLLPIPPMTIHQAFPHSRKWWPAWDTRVQFNCLITTIGSAKLMERIRNGLEMCDGDPPESVQMDILAECRNWNLLWVGTNKVAPLEPDEMEMLLGYPRNHTRGGGISRTDRYKSLGNSFQVDTVAYHLSVLKDMYPNGLNVLSLFSGIGGAEVSLHRLGIKIRTVVSVEKSKVNRDIVRSWWEQTKQTGDLIDFDDIQKLETPMIEKIMEKIGGFDLVIGGSPCNNLTGSNRVTRDGLEGTYSALFFDFFRILDSVRSFSREGESER